MAEYIKHGKLPEDMQIICTSDWHVGSRGFHEKAADGIMSRLEKEDNTYGIFNGDALEGKKIDSPHFNPDGLRAGQLNIQAQADHCAKIAGRAPEKWLSWGLGNHGLYLLRDFDIVRYICEKAGIQSIGGYQTWIDLGHFRVHAYHGRATMPRGTKDPIQREANQRAWLKRVTEELAGDCLVHLYGHVHALLHQPPIEQYTLLSKGKSVRARYFVEPTQTVRTRNPTTGKEDVREFIPPTSRHYICTGTLRRSGYFGGAPDYGEVAGYPPSPIGYYEIIIRGGQIDNVVKHVV